MIELSPDTPRELLDAELARRQMFNRSLSDAQFFACVPKWAQITPPAEPPPAWFLREQQHDIDRFERRDTMPPQQWKPLDPSTLDDAPAQDTPDIRSTEWYQFIQEIDDLLATGMFTWAESTLQGIQETVQQHHRITVGQRNAVDNIRRAREEPRHGSRRYEGFSRRY